MITPILATVSLFSADFLYTIASIAGWALFGVVLCVLALKCFDLITPGKLEEHVFKDGNTAAAIVYAGALIASGIIIASAMH